MITATPDNKVLRIQVEQGATTYIAAENPMISDVFIAQIPEMNTRTSFVLTDLLDGTIADEYLKYDGNHVILTSRMVNGIVQYEGLKIQLTNSNTGHRFTTGEYLPHNECIKTRTDKINGVNISWKYSDLANINKSEETRRAYFVAIGKSVIYE